MIFGIEFSESPGTAHFRVTVHTVRSNKKWQNIKKDNVQSPPMPQDRESCFFGGKYRYVDDLINSNLLRNPSVVSLRVFESVFGPKTTLGFLFVFIYLGGDE